MARGWRSWSAFSFSYVWRVPSKEALARPGCCCPIERTAPMRTLHIGLRVVDLERSLAFYTALGYDVVGTVPQTEFGSLTMLKLPDDEFVALELVHRPDIGRIDPQGLNHLVIKVESITATVADLGARGIVAEPPGSPD